MFLKRNALIIEPNKELAVPYMYLPPIYTVSWVTSPERAAAELEDYTPSLVFLSTSFDPKENLTFLEKYKEIFLYKIIPLIFVVDWSNKVNTILGTTWGQKIAIAHSLTSQGEMNALLDRVMV